MLEAGQVFFGHPAYFCPRVYPVTLRRLFSGKRSTHTHTHRPTPGPPPTPTPAPIFPLPAPLQLICLHQLADRTNLLGMGEDAIASLPHASGSYSSFCVSSPPPPWQPPPPLPLEQGLPLEAAAVVSTGP